MPEIVKLQEVAQQLEQEVRSHVRSSLGCNTFFLNLFSDDKKVIADAQFITLIANLIKQHETTLSAYLQNTKKQIGLISIEDCIEYEGRILMGCFIVKWHEHSQLSALSANSRYLIDRFREGLGVNHVSELAEEINSSLGCFSVFCSLIRDQDLKDDKGQSVRLGGDIQTIIQDTRHYYDSCGINQLYMTVGSLLGSLVSR